MDQGGNGSDEGHDIPDGLELHNSSDAQFARYSARYSWK